MESIKTVLISMHFSDYINPILKREILVRFREPFLRIAVGFYLIIPFIAVYSNWPSDQLFFGGSHQATNIFEIFSVCQVFLAVVFIPILGAFAITNEKENRTYEFLFTTQMRPWTISMSKLAVVLIVGFILIVCSLPSLSFIFYLGGVDTKTVLLANIFIIGESLALASLALLFSSLFRKGYVALMATWISIPLLVFSYAWLWHNNKRFFRSLEKSFERIVGLQNYLNGMDEELVLAVLIMFALPVLLIPLIIPLSRRVSEPNRGRTAKPIDSTKELQKRRRQWPYYIIDPEKRSPPVPDHANPLIFKEQLSNPLFNSAWRWRSVYILLLLIIVSCLFLNFELRAIEVFMWISLSITMVVWSALIHAVAFAGEHEGRTIEFLKLTQLTPWQYLRSKWLVCLRLRWPMIALIIATLLFVSYCDNFKAFKWGFFGYSSTESINLYLIFLIGLIFLGEITALTAILLSWYTKTIKNTLQLTLLIIAGLVFTPVWLFEFFYFDANFGIILFGIILGFWSAFQRDNRQEALLVFSIILIVLLPFILKFSSNIPIHSPHHYRDKFLVFSTGTTLSFWTLFCLCEISARFQKLWKPD
jgi:hypothetical protein